MKNKNVERILIFFFHTRFKWQFRLYNLIISSFRLLARTIFSGLTEIHENLTQYKCKLNGEKEKIEGM